MNAFEDYVSNCESREWVNELKNRFGPERYKAFIDLYEEQDKLIQEYYETKTIKLWECSTTPVEGLNNIVDFVKDQEALGDYITDWFLTYPFQLTNMNLCKLLKEVLTTEEDAQIEECRYTYRGPH